MQKKWTPGQIIEAIDRWARGGIYIKETTPAVGHAVFYIARYVKAHESTDYKKWQHLHGDGWYWTLGVSWHITKGSMVKCPTHKSPSDAARFGLEVESIHRDLASNCPVLGIPAIVSVPILHKVSQGF